MAATRETLEQELSQLSQTELKRLLIEHLTKQKLGLTWEHNAIERDRALNADVVLPRLRPDLSYQDDAAQTSFRHMVIEGDNFDALRLLRTTHANRVGVIYIDPPYNTGNKDWVYNDRYVKATDRWRHSMWLEYMFQRLTLAKELLSPTGLIFVSIDDNEGSRLAMLMDEIFGSSNHVATFIWRKVDSPNDNKPPIAPDHEYVYCYALERGRAALKQMSASGILEAYGRVDDDGRRYRDRLLKKNGKNSLRRDRPTMYFGIPGPDGEDVFPVHDNGEEARWSAAPAGIEKHRKAGTLIWKEREKLGRTVWEPYTREYAPAEPSRPYPTIWTDLPTMRQAKAMLRDIFQTADLFNTPKPVELIQRILRLVDDPDAIVLDFFAGSGTTAHAVLRQNEEDGGTRRFIMVSSTEATDAEPDKNLCRDVCARRIRAASQGYTTDSGEVEEPLPGSFAYLELDKLDPMDARMDFSPENAFQLLALRLARQAALSPDGPVKVVAATRELAVVYVPQVTPAAIQALLALPQMRLAVYSARPQYIAERLESSGKSGNSYSIGDAIMSGQAGGQV